MSNESQDLEKKDNLDLVEIDNEELEIEASKLSDEDLDKLIEEAEKPATEERPAQDTSVDKDKAEPTDKSSPEAKKEVDSDKSDQTDKTDHFDVNQKIDDAFIELHPEYKNKDGVSALDKFKGKTFKDVINSYTELEKELGGRKETTDVDLTALKDVKIEADQLEQLDNQQVKTLQEEVTLALLKGKYPDLLDDFPNAFNSKEEFSRAITSLSLDDRLASDQLVNDYHSTLKTTQEGFTEIVEKEREAPNLNNQTAGTVLDSVKRYLAKEQLTDKLIGEDFSAVDDKGRSIFIQKLLSKDNKFDERMLDPNYAKYGISILRQDAMLNKFKEVYGGLISEKAKLAAAKQAVLDFKNKKIDVSMSDLEAGKQTLSLDDDDIDYNTPEDVIDAKLKELENEDKRR
jgi:ribosomal protein L12E/L44/L45/RPP1/RPP2